jgi:hypothetical protein
MASVERKKSLKEKYKDEFFLWCHETTSHGISHSAKSKYKCMSIVWIFIFFGSIGYSSYLIAQTLIQYLSYETTVSILNINELPAKFPAVTICNINPINEEYAENFTNSRIESYKCFNTEWIKSQNYSNLQQCLKSNDTAAAFDTIIDKIKRSISYLNEKEQYYYGYDLDKDMLVSCKYNSESCSDNDFIKYWTNDNGNCYTFNSGKKSEILKTGYTGAKYGLKLELVVSKLIFLFV